jgi:trk system potassium uptake protein TrkH
MENALDRPVTSFVSRQFVLIDGEIDVAKAVETMQARNGDTIIVTRRGAPIGIVTDSDILDKVVQTGGDSDTILLKTVMTSPVITASPKATAREVLGLMRFYKIKRIPIIEDDKVVGIVTQKVLADSIRTSVLERTFRKYRSAVREQLKVLLGNMGLVIQFAGILLVVPALVGAIAGETASAAGIFLAVVGLFATGFVLNTYGERGPLNMKQSAILTIVSFLLLGLFGSIPYLYTNPFGSNLSWEELFVNSFFESVSGYTTTGLSMIFYPENMPDTMVFYHSYTQWVGGLSFIYLIMTLFYPEQKLSAMKNLISGTFLRFRQLLITISALFTIYTLALVAFTYATGSMNIIYDFSVVFSAVSTGGFSPSSTFLSLDNIPRLYIVGAGMILGALPFAFHYSIFSKELRKKLLGMEVLTYATVMVTSIPVFLVLSGTDALTAAFHVVSASTTTGFQFIDLAMLPLEAKVVLMLLMIVGGTAFSTAGGVKIGRFLFVFMRLAKKESLDIVASVTTRASEKMFRESLIVMALYVGIALLTGYAISVIEGAPFDNALFESISALSTSGLSTWILGIDSGLASKLILIANMVMGRFEIIAILYIFISWFRR